MRELARAGPALRAADAAQEEAKRLFAERGEPLKVQLIEEKGGPVVSCYTIDDIFVDFCVGPHVPSTGRLKAFKLLSTSNAYWKGDARNQPMQRVYGTAFFRTPTSRRTCSGSRRPSAATTASSGASWACSSATRGRPAPPSGSARAPCSTTPSPTTCARCCTPPATRR